MSENKYSNPIGNICVCNDCGAFSAFGTAVVKHFSTCKIGESEKWQQFYNEAEPMHWTQDMSTVEEGNRYLLCYCSNDEPNKYVIAWYARESFRLSFTGPGHFPPTWFAKITDPLRKDELK